METEHPVQNPLAYRCSRFVKASAKAMGCHWWPEAPEHRRYLAAPHVHQFEVTAVVGVMNPERAIEIHDLMDAMIEAVNLASEEDSRPDQIADSVICFGSQSCESLAQRIGERLLRVFDQGTMAHVTVMEDGVAGGGALLERLEPGFAQRLAEHAPDEQQEAE